MKMFSMSWFRSKKQEEQFIDIKKSIDNLAESIDEAIDNIEDKIDDLSLEVEEIKQEFNNHIEDGENKPYKKIKFVGDVLTVVFNDGSVTTKTNATQEDFVNVRKCYSETQILDILTVRDKQIKEDVVVPTPTEIKCVIEDDRFITIGNSIYLKEIPNRSIPPLLVKKFKEVLNDSKEFDAMKKFWLKCCLCPNAQSSEDLYEFLSKHNMKIDRHGNFYAYRRVVSLNSAVDKKLVDAISNIYNKVKAVWKKNPANFDVYQEDGEYKFTDKWISPESDGYLGNLKDLYLELPNLSGNRYTDAHTHKEDYRVGEIISMPRHLGDDNNTRSCSKGFHAASKAYDYSGFGDTPILMIINPIDVLAAPLHDMGKLRVSTWFFAMTLSEDEKYILDEDGFDVTSLGDIFEEKYMAKLNDHIHQSISEEAKRHTFTLPSISSKEVDSIVDVLNMMHNQIKHRVKNI